jgi:paraquat-inducible protein B
MESLEDIYERATEHLKKVSLERQRLHQTRRDITSAIDVCNDDDPCILESLKTDLIRIQKKSSRQKAIVDYLRDKRDHAIYSSDHGTWLHAVRELKQQTVELDKVMYQERDMSLRIETMERAIEQRPLQRMVNVVMSMRLQDLNQEEHGCQETLESIKRIRDKDSTPTKYIEHMDLTSTTDEEDDW